MKINNRFCIIITMSILTFSSCFDTALLVAGIKTTEEYADRANTDKDMVALDGSGALARFSNIQDIAVDSKDNVYVADIYSKNQERLEATLRKISAEGAVITLKKSLFSAPPPSLPIPKERLFKDSNLYIRNTTMAIKNDVLYFPANHCIYSVDLTQVFEKLTIKAYWGSCLTEDQQQEQNQTNHEASDNFYAALSDFTITDDHTFYGVGESATFGQAVFKISPNQTKAENIRFNGSLARTFGFSHDHRLFIGYFEPSPGPPPMGDGKTYTEISTTSGIKTVEHFFDHMVFDRKNRMYTYRKSEIVRYDADWTSKWIGRLSTLGPIKRMVLNPSETALYLASETAVYRLPLPKD